MKIHEKNQQTNQDLVTSTAPLYYVSKLIGLVSWDSSGDANTRTLTRGRFYIPYHVIYFFVHVILISGSFYFRLLTHTEYQYDPKIVLFNIYTSLFISIVVIVCHHIFRNSFRKTLNNLIELDKQFKAFGLNTDHKTVFKGCLGLTCFLLMTAVWFTVTTIISTKLYDVYYYPLFFFQYLVTMTMKTQFCSYNVSIKYRFKILDEKLREVIESSSNMITNNKIIMVKSAEKETPESMIYSPAYKILTLSEFHSKLYNIAKKINLFYSVQILLIIGKYFVEVTATLYYNLQKFYKKQVYDMPTFFMLIWAIMNALDLLILVFACDSMCCTVSSVVISFWVLLPIFKHVVEIKHGQYLAGDKLKIVM